MKVQDWLFAIGEDAGLAAIRSAAEALAAEEDAVLQFWTTAERLLGRAALHSSLRLCPVASKIVASLRHIILEVWRIKLRGESPRGDPFKERRGFEARFRAPDGVLGAGMLEGVASLLGLWVHQVRLEHLLLTDAAVARKARPWVVGQCRCRLYALRRSFTAGCYGRRPFLV